MSNFKELQFEQDAFFHRKNMGDLNAIHQKLDNQQGIFRLFADVAELFLPQTVNTFFKMVGADDDVVKPRKTGPDEFVHSGNIPGGRG